MKSVSGKIVSSKPIPLSKASKILSNFVSMENGASHAVSVYLRRAAVSFAELDHFHNELNSSSSLSHIKDKHSQIIVFDVEEDEEEIEKQVKKEKVKENKEIEGDMGIGLEKTEMKKKKKKKRKGEEIDDEAALDRAEQSGLKKKKKRRKTEGNP